jgi:hypothetical protein
VRGIFGGNPAPVSPAPAPAPAVGRATVPTTSPDRCDACHSAALDLTAIRYGGSDLLVCVNFSACLRWARRNKVGMFAGAS